ncbi:MAG: transglycosylase domain-containing protein, partial [Synergistaceae bacterium]|nr:transglycosylase domain-containing protein [Synergistaceae bacterium]
MHRLVLLVAVIITSIVIVCCIFMISVMEGLPSQEEIELHRINVPSIIYDRNNEIIAKLFTENRNIAELRDISPWIIKAVLAAEDSDFYSHSGISVRGMARALWA